MWLGVTVWVHLGVKVFRALCVCALVRHQIHPLMWGVAVAHYDSPFLGTGALLVITVRLALVCRLFYF